MQHGLGDVLRVDVDLQRVALAVVLLELVGLDAVGGGALLAPGRAPDPRALQDGVGVDRVDADARRAALLGQAAREVQLGRLGRRVGRGVLAGHQRVLGGDEDDRAARVLPLEDPEGLAGDEEVAGAEDRVVAVPLGQRRVLDRGARGDARRWRRRCRRRRSARTAAANAAATASSEVTSPATARPRSPSAATASARALAVEVEGDDARARGRQRLDDRAPDAARRAGDERDLALQLAGRRRLRELVELERPVLDREALAPRRARRTRRAPARRPSPRSRGGRGRATSVAAFVVVPAADQARCAGRARCARPGSPGTVVVVGVAARSRRGSRRGSVGARSRDARASASRRRRPRGRTGSTAAARLVCTRWSGHGAPTVDELLRPARERDELEHARARCRR